MALGDESFSKRTMARIRQFFGVTNTQDLSSGPTVPATSIHYGMFSTAELRHVDGIVANPKSNQVTERDIIGQLKEVSSNSKKMMDEIDTLKMMAPEISMAETIIISSIMSPVDLQTDVVSVAVDSKEISEDTQTKINELLTNYFNDEYKLGPKLVDWLGTAAFHDGAKAIMILPQTEIDVLNRVADDWTPEEIKDYEKLKGSLTASTEALQIKNDEARSKAIEDLSQVATEALSDLHVGAEFMNAEQTKKFEYKDKDGNVIKAAPLKTEAIAKNLIDNSFKILKQSEDGCGVVVTRDLSVINSGMRSASAVLDRYSAEAEKQIDGYKAKDGKSGNRPQFPVLSISDIIKTNEGDLPVLIEFPTDSVIPVCAPGDNKNHLGYFVLVNEYGQPIRGEYAFDGTSNNDMTHRLATNAARSVFGNANISSFQVAGMTDNQIMDNVTKIFSVAVNYLLKSKLNRDGLKGLSVNVHEAVGKALFYNLLSKNMIKMVFIPEPMMVYYRFDHRPDGTGKSMLEDIKFLLAMRCTLMVAKLMAAIDNATKHRVIEVQVDDKNVNPLEAMELARQTFISKKAPNITNDPRTAAESIINAHLSLRPKGMQGVVDDLSVNHETQYGQSQQPDSELLDSINNMIGQGLKIPATVLNNLNEAEYARSVATSNLFFANNVRNWQACIRPYNKKFLINYILSSHQLVKEITDIIQADLDGSKDDKTKKNTSDCIKENQEKQASELVKKVLGSIELILAPPNMSTSKAHFEELNAEADAIEKLLNLIYPDDAAPSDDLKSYMSSLRAMVASKLIKAFLPKLGVHEIAEVPDILDIDTEENKNIVLFLANLKRRFSDLTKLANGELPTNPESTGGGSTDLGGSEPSSEPSGGEEPASGGEGGGEDDLSGIPGFES